MTHPGAEPVGPKQQVGRAVEAVLTSGKAADTCGRYVTQRYLRSAYGGREGCAKAQVPGSAANELGLQSDLRVNGDRGGDCGGRSLRRPLRRWGERVTVSLVRDGLRWAFRSMGSRRISRSAREPRGWRLSDPCGPKGANSAEARRK